MLKSGVDMLLM